MKKKIISVALLLVILIFFGVWKREYTVMAKLRLIDTIYEVKCKVQHKQPVVIGMGRKHLCADLYQDGGKSCNDGSECISGQCVWTPQYKEGKAGYCKYNAAPNCYGEHLVRDGKKEDTIIICD